jgi:AbiU2
MACKTALRRKRKTISRAEAVKRLGAILKAINRDLERALAIEATLEEANRVVIATPDQIRPGPDTYATITGSLATDLAITLARLFEPMQTEERKGGGKRPTPYKSERATIPLIVHLLKQKRCRDELAARARRWIPSMPSIADSQEASCRKECAEAVEAYAALRRDHDGRQGIARLNAFRNNGIAHSLWIAPEKSGPQYRQLFRLADTARDVVGAALFAIDGHNADFLDVERIRRKDANRFWGHALRPVEEDNKHEIE